MERGEGCGGGLGWGTAGWCGFRGGSEVCAKRGIGWSWQGFQVPGWPTSEVDWASEDWLVVCSPLDLRDNSQKLALVIGAISVI